MTRLEAALTAFLKVRFTSSGDKFHYRNFYAKAMQAALDAADAYKGIVHAASEVQKPPQPRPLSRVFVEHLHSSVRELCKSHPSSPAFFESEAFDILIAAIGIAFEKTFEEWERR